MPGAFHQEFDFVQHRVDVSTQQSELVFAFEKRHTSGKLACANLLGRLPDVAYAILQLASEYIRPNKCQKYGQNNGRHNDLGNQCSQIIHFTEIMTHDQHCPVSQHLDFQTTSRGNAFPDDIGLRHTDIRAAKQ